MNVVGYCRLSRDDNKENYASIETQQEIIVEYAKKRHWVVNKFYIDDNYSGYKVDEKEDTLFDRPAFKVMMDEVVKGKVDIILTKDLSRLGRNNGLVLFLIDRFKRLNTRLIFTNEGSNGFDILEDNDDILGIKTWYNERYVKDISKKVRDSMHNKQKSGKLVMGNYYGYVKDPNDKTKLGVVESLRPCIELIFRLYIEGLGFKKISDVLNKTGYPTPSSYYRQKHISIGRVYKHNVQEKWETYMVKSILTNDVYCGTLRTHKKQTSGIRGCVKKLPPEQHYVFQNHHEAIVSIEDFDLANSILYKRAESKYRGNAKYNYIFSGFCVCGDCGFAIAGRKLKRKELTYGYDCTQYTRYGLSRCTSHEIHESRLLHHFKVFLTYMKEQYTEYINGISLSKKEMQITGILAKLQYEQNILSEELKLLYSQKIKDLVKESNSDYRNIIENSYLEMENEKKRQIHTITKRIEELNRVSANELESRVQGALDIFNVIISTEIPSRKLLELVLDKIYIYRDKSVNFKLLMDISELTK